MTLGTFSERCPEVDRHTPQPTGYGQWHAWARQMAKTHKQFRCPGCGLFQIWIPRTRIEVAKELGKRLENLGDGTV